MPSLYLLVVFTFSFVVIRNMNLSYTILDVFTETPYEGNPLAVVIIPTGGDLTQIRKQTIAREFNLSETVFVHDVENPSLVHHRHLEIFTPTEQIPFAGHPTIGAAVFLQSFKVTTLVVAAGSIEIKATPDGMLRAAVPHHLRLHERRLPRPTNGFAYNPNNELIAAECGAPLFSIVKGMTFALIELSSLDSLRTVRPGGPELSADLLDAGWRDGWVTRRYYYVRHGSTMVGGRDVITLQTRMVKLSKEDAATGSAACTLAAFLSLYKEEGRSLTFQIVQGVEMGRKSSLFVDVDLTTDTDGQRKVDTVHLGGKAVPIMNGTIVA